MDGGDRYDLNNPRDLSNVYTEDEIKAMNDEETVEALNGMWSNFCVTDAYEPGSVVKPIVLHWKKVQLRRQIHSCVMVLRLSEIP